MAENGPETGGGHQRSRPRVARGGILIMGHGVAGGRLARMLGEVTLVTPVTYAIDGLVVGAACPYAEIVLGSAVALDPDSRVVEISAGTGSEAVAYAELVIAPGPGQHNSSATADPLAMRLGLPLDDGGDIVADETLRVLGVPHVWTLDGGSEGGVSTLSRRLRGVR